MTQIFISYNRKDPGTAQYVDSLMHSFADRGWTPWIDTDGVLAGDVVRENIRQAARDCQACVVVVPESGTLSPWMIWEIELMLAPKEKKSVLFLDPWTDQRPVTGLPIELVGCRREEGEARILQRLDALLGSTPSQGPSSNHRRHGFAQHAVGELKDLADRGAYAELLTLGPTLQRYLWLIQQFEEMVEVARFVKLAADERETSKGHNPSLDDLEKEMMAQTDGVAWGLVMLGRFEEANHALDEAKESLDELHARGSAKVPYWASKVLRHRGALLVHQAYREAHPVAREALLCAAIEKLSQAQQSAAGIPEKKDGRPGLGGQQDMLAGIDHDLALAHIALNAFDEARRVVVRLDDIAAQWTPDKSCRIPLLRAWLAHRRSNESIGSVRSRHQTRALIHYAVAIAQARTAARWDIALWGCAGAAALVETPEDQDKFKFDYKLIRREWVASDTVHDAMLHRGPVVGLRDV